MKSEFYLNCDPGYKATASMLAESGLALALNADDLDVGGGVYTPATCLKRTLLKRLVETKVAEFDINVLTVSKK